MEKQQYKILTLIVVGLVWLSACAESIDALASALQQIVGSSNGLTGTTSGGSSDAPGGGPSGGPGGPPPPPGKGQGKKKPNFDNIKPEDVDVFERLKEKFKKLSGAMSPDSPVSDGPAKTVQQEMQEQAIAVVVALFPAERVNRVNQGDSKQLAAIELAVESIPDEAERNDLRQAINARKKEIAEEEAYLELREAIEKSLQQLQEKDVLAQKSLKDLEEAAQTGKVSQFKITEVMKQFDEYGTKLNEANKAFEKYQKNSSYNKAIQFLLDAKKIKQNQLDMISDTTKYFSQLYADMIARVKKLL